MQLFLLISCFFVDNSKRVIIFVYTLIKTLKKMIRVNKVKKKGEKITFNTGSLNGLKEYTIKKVVVNEERNRYEYWVSKNKCIMYRINEKVKCNTDRNRTHSGIIEFTK